MRLDQIRKLLASESASLQTLSLAAEQLCEKKSDSAAQLRHEALNRLSAALKIDNHPLLRRRTAPLRPQDIPANNQLFALQRLVLLILEQADVAQEETDQVVRSHRSLIASQEQRIKLLRAELDEYVDALTEDRADGVWSSTASQSTARRQFIAQVATMARANWPKRPELEAALQELEHLKRRLAQTLTPSPTQFGSSEQLRRRLRNIARVLDAAKHARQEVRAQRDADRQRKAQEIADAMRRAAIERESDKKRKEAVDRLQAELDDENALIQAAAQRIANREGIIEIIEDLKRKGASDPLRIAQQATIYARNVLLSEGAR